MYLAFETSDVVLSVCCYRSANDYSVTSLHSGRSHSKKIFSLAKQNLENLGAQPSDCTAILFSAGPGSFTGLRIGLSAVKGLAVGANLPIIPISTVDAAAEQISQRLPEGSTVILLQKINSTEYFFSEFTLSENIIKFKKKLEIIPATQLPEGKQGLIVLSNNPIEARGHTFFSGPDAFGLVRYFLRHSSEITPITDFGLLEPDYLREFVIKEKIKV